MDMQLAKGVRDVAPAEKIVKNKVLESMQRIFELYGFMPLETPIMERFETLAAKGGAEEGSDCLKETFQLTDQGSRKLGLRFELTTSLARYVAMDPTLKLPFKRYEMGPVFRDGPIKLGRYREFWQCDIDTIGSSSMLADAEIVAMVKAFFDVWGLDIVLKINNRKLLNGILEQAGIKDVKEALISIDKLDKIGVKGVSDELIGRGYTKKQVEGLFIFLKPGLTLDEIAPLITSAEGKQGLAELQEVFGYLDDLKIDCYQLDISLARGQAYYTGTLFEPYLVDPKEGEPKCSLAGGGRYDNMIGKFAGGGRIIPAVGISFGIEPIMDVLRSRGKVGNITLTKVYVVPINTAQASFGIVQELRNAGVAADIALGKKGVSKHFEYANALGIPYVVIVGEDELKQKKVMLRNMTDGTEQLLALKDVVKKLK
ncbi:histidine--tRNA ligase [Candidatus Woesearchaeota archaeon]|nr:histidine--tRNA ligase [Candidatus Woesearchaeota archaeon]